MVHRFLKRQVEYLGDILRHPVLGWNRSYTNRNYPCYLVYSYTGHGHNMLRLGQFLYKYKILSWLNFVCWQDKITSSTFIDSNFYCRRWWKWGLTIIVVPKMISKIQGSKKTLIQKFSYIWICIWLNGQKYITFK